MLEHLLNIEYEPEVLNAPEDAFVSIKRVDAAGLLDSQIETTDWLKALGAATDDEVITQVEQTQATQAFATAITGSPDAKAALTKITTPPAISRIVSMMTAYEWQFVEEAQRLRAMAVAKIVEETDHPDARIRLKALELDAKIKEKLLQIQNTVDEPENDEDILDVDLMEEEDGEPSE